MELKKLKFESIWIYISIFVYLLVRFIEYITGQKGSPEWAIDMMPYWLPISFWIFDNVFVIGEKDE